MYEFYWSWSIKDYILCLLYSLYTIVQRQMSIVWFFLYTIVQGHYPLSNLYTIVQGALCTLCWGSVQLTPKEQLFRAMVHCTTYIQLISYIILYKKGYM